MRLLLFSALLATAAAAQPALQPAADGPVLTVDLLHALGDDIPVTSAESPDPAGTDRIGIAASAVVLGARVPVAGVTVVAEVPVGYLGVDYPEPVGVDAIVPDDSGDLGFGNPYLGVEVRPSPGLALSGGVRLPLVGDGDSFESAGWQGGLRSESERFEAWLPDTFTASLGVAVRSALTDRLQIAARLDPSLLVPTDGDTNSEDPDFVVGGGVGVEGLAGPVTLRAGVYGRRVLTEGRYGVAEIFDTDGLATAGLSVDVGGLRPGVGVRVPLSDATFGQDATVALRLDVPLR